ncbi:hypothetical protein C0995_010450 [Termitomyces sp. Mi166|nr:hypothetical protein C0995_010450 [Termitomyces sp. Mi166\
MQSAFRLSSTSLRALLSRPTRVSTCHAPVRFFSNFRSTGNTLLRQKVNASVGPTFAKGSRTFMTEGTKVAQNSQGISWQRMAMTAAGVAGAVVVIEGIFNRETRDSLTLGEESLLHSTFQYTGAGLALTALAARQIFRSGATFRILTANPWVVLGVSLVGSIGSMMGVFYTPPEKTIQKHLFWLAFNGFQAATLSPLLFLNPALLSRAALYTFGVVGSLSYVGATATTLMQRYRTDKYLNWGGPLLAGVTVVALSSLAPMALPLGMRGLAITEAIYLYGGLAVFGGFVLYE